MQTETLQTPVAFFVFNRPHTTRQVFDAISRARPPDCCSSPMGPRQDWEGEAETCRQVRDIVARVDWPCEVFQNFSERNLGCQERMISGLDWVFLWWMKRLFWRMTAFQIPSFFPFVSNCSRSTVRTAGWPISQAITWWDDTGSLPAAIIFRESVASGDGLLGVSEWKRYDRHLSDWPELRKQRILEEIFDEPKAVEFWTGLSMPCMKTEA